jgi:hypothetical protein
MIDDRTAQLTRLDRLAAWLVTGPVGRLAAFLLDLGAILIRGAIQWWSRRTDDDH